jgi:hypothetical protein
MTAPLRKLHRRVVLVLALLLPAIFAAGLALRHAPLPANPALEEIR